MKDAQEDPVEKAGSVSFLVSSVLALIVIGTVTDFPIYIRFPLAAVIGIPFGFAGMAVARRVRRKYRVRRRGLPVEQGLEDGPGRAA
ncbi:hypothetical protein [Falsarthrobacter nasiphocae]|uniref:Uncharacterized protein n=1 Tax=Falsarthrobacter nasiphocae TaxID=189863 RepID=A0AAE4C6A7_9MICC|nr:hypothetical protein [Falsarthrobacter nasiphocae]MDR6891294.1 hypothetical protein [Falsarthrobacter nasiphocae]